MATYKQLTLMCYTKLEDHWFDYSTLQQTIEISTHTVQKLIVISNKFPRTFDSILSSYVIDAY